MNRLEFIFSAVNAIASKRHEPITEYLLAEAVRREIEAAKQELVAKMAAAGGADDKPLGIAATTSWDIFQSRMGTKQEERWVVVISRTHSPLAPTRKL